MTGGEALVTGEEALVTGGEALVTDAGAVAAVVVALGALDGEPVHAAPRSSAAASMARVRGARARAMVV